MAGTLFKTILEYQKSPDMDIDSLPVEIKLILLPLIQQFKRDNEKYDAKCQSNKKNGKSGGRPKTQHNPTKPTITQNNRTVISKTQHNPTKPYNDTDTDTDTDNDTVSVPVSVPEKENTNTPPIIPQAGDPTIINVIMKNWVTNYPDSFKDKGGKHNVGYVVTKRRELEKLRSMGEIIEYIQTYYQLTLTDTGSFVAKAPSNIKYHQDYVYD